MRWFLNYITARFQALYEVDGNVSVDESMIKFKGRLAFRQYLPMKPTKWGVKVWVMSESSTGYVTNFQIYAGREGSTEKGLAHRVVMDLAGPYYGSHLSVYMDNFLHRGAPLGGDEEPWPVRLRHCSCQPGGTPKEREAYKKSLNGKARVQGSSEGRTHVLYLAGHENRHGAVQPSQSN